ncbi:hypothetical protein PRIC1_001617 [Phytophthora ramorum]
MPAPATTTAPPSPQTPLSVQRPALSPRKRKFSNAVEAASPTSLDQEVASSSSSSSSSKLEISPKKKARAEERSSGDLSKWESHVVASIASALDLGCMDDKDEACEPLAFCAAPAGDLAADELEILRHFLA